MTQPTENSDLPPVVKSSNFMRSVIKIALFPFKFILIWFEPAENLSPTMRHSYFISRIKISLMSLSIVLILGLIIWPLTDFGKEQFKISFENAENDNADGNVSMKKARFYGVDKNNQPYNVTADTAVQKSENVIQLNKVYGDIALKEGKWLSLLSNEGTYDIKAQNIELVGNVSVFTDQGYEFKTRVINIDLETNSAKGSEPVDVQGPLGTLTAKGFVISDGGDIIYFYGGINLVTYPAGGKH